MAHKKGSGSSRNGETALAAARRSGLTELVRVVPSLRQHGRKPGKNGPGQDHSLFALSDGNVRFEDHGSRGLRVSVIPAAS